MKSQSIAARFVLAVFSAILALSLLVSCSDNSVAYEVVGVRPVYQDTITWRFVSLDGIPPEIGRSVERLDVEVDSFSMNGESYISNVDIKPKNYKIIGYRSISKRELR